ncbi:MAG: rRNA pseudouridine synthase [Magnetococcales bacterium]|nr:rRNA pseudouridine synthase [Magnetococcales bacterium]
MADEVRLQKWLAETGLCSRREGERWIEAGRVKVNGKVVTAMGTKVSKHDKIAVDGKPLPPKRAERTVVLALNKPTGRICTKKDPEGRPTIYGLLGRGHTRLISVGRLDINSEGLLLLSNDGDLVHKLTHPSNEVSRIYRVRVHGRISEDFLAKLKKGVQLEDGHTGPLDVALDGVQGANSWLTLTLKEGRNRLIRRIFKHFEMDVGRLIRVSYGGVELGDVAKGTWRSLTQAEIKKLWRSVGS